MILLTGGSGQLGTAIRSRRDGLVAPTRSELDLSRPQDLTSRLHQIEPSAIINCAGYTAVDRAEDEPDSARVVNAIAVGVLAEYAATVGIPFVTFSTDYVFDGRADTPYLESSPTAPINAYGRSKERGEQAALAAHPGTLVVRTSWVISATHRNFVTTIMERADAGPVNVVSDQLGCPTYAPDLAAATLAAFDTGATGILHLTNRGQASWYELARTACNLAGIDPDRVRPITSDEYPTKAARPRYSVLGTERLADLGLTPCRPWEDALALTARSTAVRNGLPTAFRLRTWRPASYAFRRTRSARGGRSASGWGGRYRRAKRSPTGWLRSPRPARSCRMLCCRESRRGFGS